MIDSAASPPALIDSDSNPATTDDDDYDPATTSDQPLPAGITKLSMIWEASSGGAETRVSNTHTAANGRGLVVSADGQWLYSSRNGNPHIVVFNVGDDTITASDRTFISMTPGAVGGPVPGGGPVAPGTGRADGMLLVGSKLYYASSTENKIRIFDVVGPVLTQSSPSEIALPGVLPSTRNLAVLPDGRFLYASSRAGALVDVVDLTTSTHVASIPTGLFTEGVSASPDSKFLFVGSGEKDVMLTVDARSGSSTIHQVIAVTAGSGGAGWVIAAPGLATPTGSGVAVQPDPMVALNFSGITASGSTTVTSANVSALPTPAGFRILGAQTPVYYEVKTTATFAGPVQICLSYTDAEVASIDESTLRLMHEEGGVLVDRTIGAPATDPSVNRICGSVTSFSQFAIMVQTGMAPTVGTPTSTSITDTAATLGGNVTSDGGSTITERGVVYSLTATNANPLIGAMGVTKSTVSGNTGLFASGVTGLVPVSGYSFKAYATNVLGTSYTSVAIFTTLATVPGAPTIATATAGDATVSVAFTAPSNTGGSAITGYIATCGTKTGTGTASPIAVTGLTNGMAVTCTVLATNAVGNSAASAASNSVTPVGLPGAPAIGAATAGNATASVTFTAPTSTGGSAITGYTATCGAKTATGTASPITVTGLTNGTAVTCTVVATNAVGNSAASAASNSVTPGPVGTDIPRLVNIATRAKVQTGDNVMIAGFIIGGNAPKKVLITARGPSLAVAPFNVPGTLADPFMQLYSGQTVIDSNDDFGTRANAGEIPSDKKPSNAKEAAILTTLSPGAYTAIVTGVGSTSGVAIVEVFEIDLPEIPLINIATRSRVETGDDVMIAGFVIQGNAARTVLVTARGPSLAVAPFNVPNTLADPYMRIYSGQTVIHENDNWMDGANASLIPETQKPKDPKDAALVVTLAPGAYTVIVGGGVTSTGSGVAIVEVFVQ